MPGLTRDHLDLTGVGQQLGGVDRLGDDVVDLDDLRVLEWVNALQPREIDEVADQVREPLRLDLHAGGEPLHRVGIVAGGLYGLGEEREGTDGCLELMGDVGDEVAAHSINAYGLGQILDEHQGGRRRELGDAHPGVEHALAQGRPAQLEVLLADHSVAADHGDEGEHFGDLQSSALLDAQDRGERGGPQDAVVGADDEGRAGKHREQASEALGNVGGRHAIRLGRGHDICCRTASAEHPTTHRTRGNASGCGQCQPCGDVHTENHRVRRRSQIPGNAPPRETSPVVHLRILNFAAASAFVHVGSGLDPRPGRTLVLTTR